MKKAATFFLAVMMLMVCVSALATTHVETGEQLILTGSQLKVYDTIVYQAFKPAEVHHGVKVADHTPIKEAMAIVTASLLDGIASGDILDFDVVGIENVFGPDAAAALQGLSPEEKAKKLIELLSALDDFDPAVGFVGMGEPQTLDALPNDSMASGFGTVMIDGVAVPFVRITIKALYAPKGDYANLSEAQRIFYENYVFIYGDESDGTKGFNLYSISQYAPAFFGQDVSW